MVEKKIENSVPFIIWTFRRTGGTNLGQALFNASPYQQVEHEPFNYDRVFGEVTRRFKDSGDVGQLRKDLESILEKRPLIKHCLEIIPQELNLILAELSVKFGYKSIFLYREYAKDRILSLNYAQTTGVWGKEQKNKLEENPNIFKTPFPVNRMIHHEYRCRQKMTGVFSYLVSSGVSPVILSFEALYQHKNYEYSCMLVSDLFAKLHLCKEIVTESFLEKMLKRGGQGTKSDYLRFPGADEFVSESLKLPKYTLHSEGTVDVKIVSKRVRLKHVEIWPALNGLALGEVFISGIFLADNSGHSTNFTIDKEPVNVKMNLPSPRMKEMFPDEAASAKCRFIAGPILASGQVELVIDSDNFLAGENDERFK